MKTLLHEKNGIPGTSANPFHITAGAWYHKSTEGSVPDSCNSRTAAVCIPALPSTGR